MVQSINPLPVYTPRQVSDFLVSGYWKEKGVPAHAFPLGADRALSVNMNDVSLAQRETARLALEAWTATTGIRFTFVSDGAEITLKTSRDYEANSSVTFRGSTSTSAQVVVGEAWAGKYGYGLGSYTLQTWIHEIGHALGLGHAGIYDGAANYETSALYANDSWQMSVMSYFSQWENTFIDADHAYVMTPMLADFLAIRDLYGTVSPLRTGNSIYGNNANTGDYYEKLQPLLGDVSWTIVDNGGIDTLDISGDSTGARIDLRPGGISDAWGMVGNLVIDNASLLENLSGGSGSDWALGNQAANRLHGRDGNDTLIGAAGRDTLQGGRGDDSLLGGLGSDTLIGASEQDTLVGGFGNDSLTGGAGNDRLWGSDGNDRLAGGMGRDSLSGGQGNDTLLGDAGADLLSGGYGDDTLFGGADADRFIFTFRDAKNADVIIDFSADSGDRLLFGEELWGGGLVANEVVDRFCRIERGDAFFEFDDLNTLRLDGITSIDQLYGCVGIL